MEAGSAAPEPSGVELSIDRRELRQARTAALPTRHEIARIERSAIAERLAHSLEWSQPLALAHHSHRLGRVPLLSARSVTHCCSPCSRRRRFRECAPSTKGWRNPRTCCVLCGRNSSPTPRQLQSSEPRSDAESQKSCKPSRKQRASNKTK